MSISPDYFKQQYGLSTTHSEVQAWVEAGHLNHGHVLDLGCGRGRNALYLAKHGFEVHACDADEASIALIQAGVPRTEAVRREQADDFWARRRGLFFKPASGFGSRGAYRGDKLTKRVFDEILAGDYIAQAFVPPSERRVAVEGAPVDLKMDLRNYVYQGEVQLVTARLYRGQTTNFRTPGGGFAPVLAVPCGHEGAA